MTFKYRLGQKVEILSGRFSEHGAKYVGLVGIILQRNTFPTQHFVDFWAKAGNYYVVEGCDEFWFMEHTLRPLNDGDNPSTWDECAWRPNLEHPVVPLPSHPNKETA